MCVLLVVLFVLLLYDKHRQTCEYSYDNNNAMTITLYLFLYV